MLISFYAHEPGLSQRFCKNGSDSSLESLTVTRVESSNSVKNVTRFESPFFSTWLEWSPSHQKSWLESSGVSDSSHAIAANSTGAAVTLSATATCKQSRRKQGLWKDQTKRHLKVPFMHMEVRALFGPKAWSIKPRSITCSSNKMHIPFGETFGAEGCFKLFEKKLAYRLPVLFFFFFS